jgi:hypothetical protein
MEQAYNKAIGQHFGGSGSRVRSSASNVSWRL